MIIKNLNLEKNEIIILSHYSSDIDGTTIVFYTHDYLESLESLHDKKIIHSFEIEPMINIRYFTNINKEYFFLKKIKFTNMGKELSELLSSIKKL